MERLMKMLNLKKAGWCTPTILVVTLGLLTAIALVVQLITNRDKTKMKALVASLISHILWTGLVGYLLFWLCGRGKLDAAWWIFGILYILPVALMFILLAGYFYVEAEKQ